MKKAQWLAGRQRANLIGIDHVVRNRGDLWSHRRLRPQGSEREEYDMLDLARARYDGVGAMSRRAELFLHTAEHAVARPDETGKLIGGDRLALGHLAECRHRVDRHAALVDAIVEMRSGGDARLPARPINVPWSTRAPALIPGANDERCR